MNVLYYNQEEGTKAKQKEENKMLYVFTKYAELIVVTKDKEYANSVTKDINGFVLSEDELTEK